ncbi:MAG: glycosyltransferase family 2 protein [Microthrixaceae bacterium]|jgi:glycosyltransferase involved in cell wall biosynthesis/CMP-N-acetylneuraminic acid synthetase
MADDRPTVTVYVTCHNYARFLAECLDSVFAQSLPNWELLIFDDGSTDDSRAIAEEYVTRSPSRVRLFSTEAPRGLRSCANDAIKAARGRYLMRLDADDYLDENALLVLAHRLDADRDLALVYPNWTYIGESGEVLGVERRKRLGDETEMTDLPPHGACTMVRLRALKVTGGYDEAFDSQDGHELWLKLSHRYRVASVSTPLFFYRQHGSSMSRDEDRLLASRRAIKRQAVDRWSGGFSPQVLGVVPVKNTYSHLENVALAPLAGRALIDHTLDEALAAGCFQSVVVTTDDAAVVDHCVARGDVSAFLRPTELSAPTSRLTDVLVDAVERCEREMGLYPDIVALLSVHTPLRTRDHIREAVDSLLLYDSDHVLTTYEDLDIHFRHGRSGMEPLNPGMTNRLRYERESLFVDNGAVHVLWRDLIEPDVRVSGRVGHTVMARSDSVQLKSWYDHGLIEHILSTKTRSAT